MCVVFEHIETQRRKQIQDGWLDCSLNNILVLHSTQTDNQATLHVWKVAQVMQNHSLGDKWTCSHLSDVFAARLSVNSASSSALSSTVRCGARASAAAVSCGGAASRAPCVCVCVRTRGCTVPARALAGWGCVRRGRGENCRHEAAARGSPTNLLLTSAQRSYIQVTQQRQITLLNIWQRHPNTHLVILIHFNSF